MAAKSKKSITDKTKLADALATLRKNGVTVGNLTDTSEEVEAFSTGSIIIDVLTDCGGIPRGRVTELYGPPSCGKTTTALQAAATVQKAGGTVLYVDYEHALDKAYCAALGLDVDAESFLHAPVETIEEGAKIIRSLVNTGEIDLVVVDSVASITTEAELEAVGQRRFQDKPLLIAQLLRQLVGELKNTNTALILVNHLMTVVDMSPMGQRMTQQGIVRKTTPGGKAVHYYASLRIEYKQIGSKKGRRLNPVTNEEEEVKAQTDVLVKIEKNKVGVPHREATVVVRYGKGFSNEIAAIRVLVAYGLIKRTGAAFALAKRDADPDLFFPPGVESIRGEDHFARLLEGDPEWAAVLIAKARTLLFEASEKSKAAGLQTPKVNEDGEPLDSDFETTADEPEDDAA